MNEQKQAIIFLDIDGVLNSFKSFDWGTAPLALLLPECVARFNRIIESTEAQIVLSSSWRHYVLGGSMTLLGLERLLRSHGVRGNLIDTTCDDEEADERGEQIRLWRRAHKHRGRYVVLDDLDDGISERGLNAVFTNGSVGLTDADVSKALEFLAAKTLDET